MGPYERRAVSTKVNSVQNDGPNILKSAITARPRPPTSQENVLIAAGREHNGYLTRSDRSLAAGG